jgi:hypothetical protein
MPGPACCLSARYSAETIVIVSLPCRLRGAGGDVPDNMRESCGDLERGPMISCHLPPEIPPVGPQPRAADVPDNRPLPLPAPWKRSCALTGGALPFRFVGTKGHSLAELAVSAPAGCSKPQIGIWPICGLAGRSIDVFTGNTAEPHHSSSWSPRHGAVSAAARPLCRRPVRLPTRSVTLLWARAHPPRLAVPTREETG